MRLILDCIRYAQSRTILKDEIPAEQLAAFIDGRLGSEERARVESRLAADPEARAEMIAASRLAAQAEERPPLRKTAWKSLGFAAAAAAVLAVLVLPGDRPWTRTADLATERRSTIEDGGRITLLSPSETQPVSPGPVAFAWRSESNASYRLTLADSSGSTIWTTSTAAAEATLPDSIRLSGASRYYWYVDAMLLDGSSITSGPRAFTTRAR